MWFLSGFPFLKNQGHFLASNLTGKINLKKSNINVSSSVMILRIVQSMGVPYIFLNPAHRMCKSLQGIKQNFPKKKKLHIVWTNMIF